MLLQLGFAILADDVGLGKTIVALAAAQTFYDNAPEPVDGKSEPLTPRRQWPIPDSEFTPPSIQDTYSYPRNGYKPTLVLLPNVASGSWKDDAKKFKSLKVFKWYGNSKTLKGGDTSNLIGGSVDALMEVISTLDPADPNTGKTVILTTHATFTNRAGSYADGKKVNGKSA